MMPLSYRKNIPPVGLPHKDFTRPIKMPEDLEPKQRDCHFGPIWSDEAINELKAAYHMNLPVRKIASLFPTRSLASVKTKIYSLGLFR